MSLNSFCDIFHFRFSIFLYFFLSLSIILSSFIVPISFASDSPINYNVKFIGHNYYRLVDKDNSNFSHLIYKTSKNHNDFVIADYIPNNKHLKFRAHKTDYLDSSITRLDEDTTITNYQKSVGYYLTANNHYIKISKKSIAFTSTKEDSQIFLIKTSNKAITSSFLANFSREAFDQAIPGKKIKTFGGYKISSTLSSKLKKAISKFNTHISFTLADMKSGFGISYNPSKKYYPASTIKGAYVASIGKLYPSYVNKYYKLMVQTIRPSSNSAFESLVCRFGKKPLNKWLNLSHISININQPHCWPFTKYSTTQNAKIWTTNYMYFFSNDKQHVKVRNIFQKHSNPINDLLASKKCKTYTKSGTMHSQGKHKDAAHTAGIVKCTDNLPYIISVFSSVPGNLKKLNTIVKLLNQVHKQMIS